MNTRSFIKRLAMMTAGAAMPGIFIPKLEAATWRVTKGEFTQSQLNNWERDLVTDPNEVWFQPMNYYGEWQFLTTTFRLLGNVFVPDDMENFEPYSNTDIQKQGVIRVKHIQISQAA